MIIKNKIKKSFFDILPPPIYKDKRQSPNLLNVPIDIVSKKCLWHNSFCDKFITNLK